LKRIARFFIANLYPPLKPFLYLFRPADGAVKVIIFYKNKLLLIKNTYRKGWTLPGGGVKKNESPKQTAIREVYEEVGMHVSGLRNHGFFILDFDRGGKVTVFSCKVKSSAFKIDNLEIEEAAWVDMGKLRKRPLDMLKYGRYVKQKVHSLSKQEILQG